MMQNTLPAPLVLGLHAGGSASIDSAHLRMGQAAQAASPGRVFRDLAPSVRPEGVPGDTGKWRANQGNPVRATGYKRHLQPMILAKSCRYGPTWIVGPCSRSVLRFPRISGRACLAGAPTTGGLSRSTNAPITHRVLFERAGEWAQDHRDLTNEESLKALRRGPCGRCVYRSDNDGRRIRWSLSLPAVHGGFQHVRFHP